MAYNPNNPPPLDIEENVELAQDMAPIMENENHVVQPVADAQDFDDDARMEDLAEPQEANNEPVDVNQDDVKEIESEEDSEVLGCEDLTFPKGYENFNKCKRLCQKWEKDKKDEGFKLFKFDPREGKFKCTTCEAAGSAEKYASYTTIPWNKATTRMREHLNGEKHKKCAKKLKDSETVKEDAEEAERGLMEPMQEHATKDHKLNVKQTAALIRLAIFVTENGNFKVYG